MRKAVGLGAVGLALTLAAPAMAKEAGTGFEVGLRSGYALPLGDVGRSKLSDVVSGHVPLWLDLGGRITPNIMVGGYVAYGFGLVKEDCAPFDCSAHNLRIGAQFHYHFLPWESVDPWIGAGIGYEWFTISQSGSGTVLGNPIRLDLSQTGSGFEFINLQAGLDLLPSDGTHLALGPFVAFSVAQASHVSCSGTGVGSDCGGDVESTTHEWLTLGVRGTFVP